MTKISRLPSPRPDWCFFLDVDGTLLEIAETPESVVVEKELIGLLESLHRAAGGALAVVSGRPIADLDRLFHPLRLPAAGLHGLEIRPRGDSVRLTVDKGPLEHGLGHMRKALADFAAGRPGVLMEDKGLSLALHYRQAPDQARACRACAERVCAKFGEGFDMLKGKMVLEIKPKGVDKGKVVELFMAEPPFAGRQPLFVGDDVTDEAGFVAVNALGGLSIRVGATERTAAAYSVPDVACFRAWLAEVSAAMAALAAAGKGLVEPEKTP